MKTKSGFTIVELLIVIVVIAILAAITIVAYNGIQAKARDNVRYNDAKAIMKALELYKADKGTYPTHTASPAANGCNFSGYSNSWSTDGTWMKLLVDEGYMKTVPKPPGGSCTNQYAYIRVNATGYNCPSRTANYYVLWILGTDSTHVPLDASSTETSPWRPCTGATAAWGGNKTQWAFVREES